MRGNDGHKRQCCSRYGPSRKHDILNASSKMSKLVSTQVSDLFGKCHEKQKNIMGRACKQATKEDKFFMRRQRYAVFIFRIHIHNNNNNANLQQK